MLATSWTSVRAPTRDNRPSATGTSGQTWARHSAVSALSVSTDPKTTLTKNVWTPIAALYTSRTILSTARAGDTSTGRTAAYRSSQAFTIASWCEWTRKAKAIISAARTPAAELTAPLTEKSSDWLLASRWRPVFLESFFESSRGMLGMIASASSHVRAQTSAPKAMPAARPTPVSSCIHTRIECRNRSEFIRTRVAARAPPTRARSRRGRRGGPCTRRRGTRRARGGGRAGARPPRRRPRPWRPRR